MHSPSPNTSRGEEMHVYKGIQRWIVFFYLLPLFCPSDGHKYGGWVEKSCERNKWVVKVLLIMGQLIIMTHGSHVDQRRVFSGCHSIKRAAKRSIKWKRISWLSEATLIWVFKDTFFQISGWLWKPALVFIQRQNF